LQNGSRRTIIDVGILDWSLVQATVIDGCNSFVVPESGAKNLVVSEEKTMIWNQRLGNIGDRI